ncbi:Flagellar hook-associated protein 1 [gamma proteobacterium HdN1]|nr:Flagellar hook-associated protein 1 [gamma proteobacterium HdN1]
MADITQIGLSGLMVSKSALSTTSHNIVNVGTDGYSRQRVDISAIDPIKLGGKYIGQGAIVNGISRITNTFLTDQLRRDTQNFNSYDSYFDFAGRVDSLLGDQSTAITPTLQGFFNSVQDLNNDPASIPIRQVMLSEANALTNRFNTVYEQLYQQNQALNTAMQTITSEITERASELASLNLALKVATTNGVGAQPNDLLDQRDQALKDLSTLVGISVSYNPDNTVDVSVGTGQPLVLGGDSFQLTADDNVTGYNHLGVKLTTANLTTDISSQISGGRLGGLLKVRDELIDPVFNELGRLSMVISDTVNKQHKLGMDLNSNLGNNFFTNINEPWMTSSRVATGVKNTGNAGFSVTIDDSTKIKATDYTMRFDGTNLNLVDNATGQLAASLTPTGVPPESFALAGEGFTITIESGTLQDGDMFTVAPTRTYASQVGVKVNNVEQIAAASPVRTTWPAANTGRGYVEKVIVTETDDPVTGTAFVGARGVPPTLALQPPYQIVFTSGATYDVYDATNMAAPIASGTFVPNQSNLLLDGAGIVDSGYDVSYNGVPVTGDILNIEYNAGGITDNRNSALLGALRTSKTVLGTSSYQETYAKLVSGVGTRTRDAGIGQEASQSIMRQTQAQRDAVSAVNMDEEAADLIKFQQQYMATSKIIQVSQQLFDAILGVV